MKKSLPIQPSLRLDQQRGAVIILVALLMVVFLGIAALVIDLSAQYVVSNELQNAADAGALGGARVLHSAPPLSSDSDDNDSPWGNLFDHSAWRNLFDHSAWRNPFDDSAWDTTEDDIRAKKAITWLIDKVVTRKGDQEDEFNPDDIAFNPDDIARHTAFDAAKDNVAMATGGTTEVDIRWTGTANNTEDIQIGHWDFDKRSFIPAEQDWKTLIDPGTGLDNNAIKVVTRRGDQEDETPAPSFFARLFGYDDFPRKAKAVAYFGPPAPSIGDNSEPQYGLFHRLRAVMADLRRVMDDKLCAVMDAVFSKLRACEQQADPNNDCWEDFAEELNLAHWEEKSVGDLDQLQRTIYYFLPDCSKAELEDGDLPAANPVLVK